MVDDEIKAFESGLNALAVEIMKIKHDFERDPNRDDGTIHVFQLHLQELFDRARQELLVNPGQ